MSSTKISRGEMSFLIAMALGLLVGMFIKQVRLGLLLGLIIGVVVVFTNAVRSKK